MLVRYKFKFGQTVHFLYEDPLEGGVINTGIITEMKTISVGNGLRSENRCGVQVPKNYSALKAIIWCNAEELFTDREKCIKNAREIYARVRNWNCSAKEKQNKKIIPRIITKIKELWDKFQ